MSTELLINRVKELVEPLLEADMFLVDMRIKPTNNIKVYLDSDSGLPLEKCIRVNRALYKKIEEAGMFPNGDFSLEVSSPGVDEPLKLHRQYLKNVGRNVEVSLIDDRQITGKMTAAGEKTFSVQSTAGKGKKAVTTDHEIDYNDAKSVKILISF